MRINTILYRYIFTELIPPLLINLLFFVFVFLLAKILDITKMIVNYRVSLVSVFWLLIYSLPHFLEFIIPMAVMVSILLTFLRLSSDNEIMALKAGGLSLYGLLPPVMLFCLLGALVTGGMSVYGLPWGRTAFKDLTLKLAASHADIALKAGTFNDAFKDVMLYAHKIDPQTKTLYDVFIEDRRNKDITATVVAPRGELVSDGDALSFRLRLYNGTMNQVDLERRAAHTLHFDTYDVYLDLKKVISATSQGPKDEKEMSLAELKHYLKSARLKDAQYYVTLIELHKKFSVAVACFALGILAVPLGLTSRSAKRSFGLGLGLICFLCYYLMLSAGWVFGEAGIYPPLVGMWAPNIVMGGLGLFLLIRAANERPLNIARLPHLMRQALSGRLKSDSGGNP